MFDKKKKVNIKKMDYFLINIDCPIVNYLLVCNIVKHIFKNRCDV